MFITSFKFENKQFAVSTTLRLLTLRYVIRTGRFTLLGMPYLFFIIFLLSLYYHILVNRELMYTISRPPIRNRIWVKPHPFYANVLNVRTLSASLYLLKTYFYARDLRAGSANRWSLP